MEAPQLRGEFAPPTLDPQLPILPFLLQNDLSTVYLCQCHSQALAIVMLCLSSRTLCQLFPSGNPRGSDRKHGVVIPRLEPLQLFLCEQEVVSPCSLNRVLLIGASC